MDIKGKLERHLTGRLPSLGGEVDKIPFARAVYKACDSKDQAPKTKHIRRIILETHNVEGGVSLFRELAKRPLHNSEVSCWKAMNMLHRVMMDGHPKVLKDARLELDFIEGLRGQFARSRATVLGGMLPAHSDFLLSKVRFHNAHTDFNGNISLDAYLQHTNNRLPNDAECLEIVTHLLDHQDAALRFERDVLGMLQLNSTQVFGLIPLVLETYAVYSVITYFLRQLVNRVGDKEVFDFFCQRYYSQYIDLREFYSKGSNINSLATIVPIPMLPADPPQFVTSGGLTLEGQTRKRRQRTSSKGKASTGQASPQAKLDLFAPPPSSKRQPPPPSNLGNPFLGLEDQRARSSSAPGWVTFVPSFNPPPTAVPVPAVSQFPPVSAGRPQAESPTQPPPQAARPRAETTRVPSQPAASNSFFLQLMGLKAGDATPENTNVPSLIRTNTSPSSMSARRPSNKPDYASPSSQPKTDDYLSYRRSDPPPAQSQPAVPAGWAAEVPKAAESASSDELRKVKEELATLMARLSTVEEQNKELISANTKLTAENKDLKNKIEQIEEDHEEERRQRMLKELQTAFNAVDSYLFALDSPANVGNRNATAQILLASSKKLAEEIATLFATVKSGKEDDIRAAVARVVAANKEFMDNAKGCTYLTQNPDLQQALLKAARGTGSSVAQLLSGLVLSVNMLEDWTDVDAVQKQYGGMQEQLQQVEAAVDSLITDRAGEQPAAAEPKEDLEALAEQELVKAAKIIEDAARQLSSVKAQPRPPQPSGKMDLSGPILDAAQAIADAAQHLIRAASEAQKERMAKGIGPNKASSYKVDPAWSEGLISAAKFVALATQQLVSASSKLADGQLKDADLIAASKAVAAATAQLVAASTVKADTFSKPQENLVKASGLVKRATDQLVDAARKMAAQAQEMDVDAMDFTKLSHAEYKVKQVNQMAKIFELEKEISKQREVLTKMRKAEYSIVNPYANTRGEL